MGTMSSGNGQHRPRDLALLGAGVLIAGTAILYGPLVATLLPIVSVLLTTLLVYVAVFAPMAVAALGLGAVSGVKAYAPGAAPGRWLAIGLAIGVAGLTITVGYTWIVGALVLGATGGLIGPGLVAGFALILFQVVCEEVFFRGWVQPMLARFVTPLVALGIGAMLFAGFHILGGARSPVTLANLLLGGVWFGLLAWRSGGILAPTAAHFGWNASEQLIFGLDPNPGIGDFGTLFDWDLTGPSIWGGSAEGLNASIAMTFVMLALVVPWLVSAPSPRAPRRPGHAPA